MSEDNYTTTPAEPPLPPGADRDLQTAAVRNFCEESAELIDEAFVKIFGRRPAAIVIIHDNPTECLTISANVHDDDVAALFDEVRNRILEKIKEAGKH